ncbi:hypothetical protein HHK36_003456 [Tetracentron sinense]|uniref:WRKY domain-containing protein n=1 Tax=Tetracentron sinense TaxID=13715 RepID=A0A834ZNS1_TETSI|nr:hypothetical protein HHK36_003456 [Tetracentron sinense]
MAGIDDHASLTGDWSLPNPSPRTFFSSELGDDIGSGSFSELLGENRNEGPFVGSEIQTVPTSTKEDDFASGGVSGDRFSESGIFPGQKSSSRGGLSERMAARAGFNAPRLNTAGIRSPNLSSSSPKVRSPYLTIPPGLSPTTLLDSPVFLSNSLAQPSPTTGKFPFALNGNSRSSILISEARDRSKDNLFEDTNTSSFAFKPLMESNSSFFPGAANKVIILLEFSFDFKFESLHINLIQLTLATTQQSFPTIEVSVQSENSHLSRSLVTNKIHSQMQNGLHPQAEFSRSSIEKDTGGNDITSDPRVSDTAIGNTEHSPLLDDQQDGGDQKGGGDSNSMVVAGAPSEDGYNWRKYGQKQVKGSEFPRSYYKCTNPNCQVKKKVERSLEGHITEIIYKGAHNHPKPPPNRRSAVGSSNVYSDMQLDIPEQAGAQAGADDYPVWASTQQGPVGGGPNWRHDNLEVTSSTSVDPKLCDPSTSLQAQNDPQLETGDAMDVLSTLSNDEDEDDWGTHGSVSLGYDGEGDESESKRRRTDACPMEVSGATRAIREPRVVVQTTSEVDILDDGYRWRKYGQKVVKGNPNPRSYYKCTNAGCTVRKHVERASHDLKSVITTYEGKHNHDVPAARNSSHVNSGTSSTVPSQAAQTNVHRPGPHDSMGRFERPASLASFDLSRRQQLGPSPGISFGMSQPGLASLTMAGLGSSQGKLPVHPYLGQQMGFMMPKEEPKESSMLESGLNLSNGSSVYNQIMSRLPLGPQL